MPCDDLAWNCSTDSTLGDSDTEYVFASYDTVTALESYEAICDPSQGITAEYDTTITTCIIGLWIWILSHLNQQNSTSGGVLPIRIRTIPINTPPIPFRVIQKVHQQGGSGGGSG